MTDPSVLLDETRRELARFPGLLDAMVAGLTLDRWRARPAPDEWAAVEIVCHLRDEEAEDFGARVRVLLEGGTRFAPIDPEGWALARRYHEADPADALVAFRRRRAENLAILAAAAPERLTTSGESPSGSRLSGLDLLAAWVAHDGLHLRQLAGTLTREWADRWAPLRVGYAGPIPYRPDAPETDA
jgi:DinB superfamily